MSNYVLTSVRVVAGTWEGRVERRHEAVEREPILEARHNNTPIDTLTLEPITGTVGAWLAKFDVPRETISDGVHTILLLDAETAETLGSLPMVIGEPLAEEQIAEIHLLRAELDMLKRAFRRHCTETG